MHDTLRYLGNFIGYMHGSPFLDTSNNFFELCFKDNPYHVLRKYLGKIRDIFFLKSVLIKILHLSTCQILKIPNILLN